MSSPVVAKEFLWKFRDEITQGVAKARQAMQEAVSTAKEAGMKASDTGEDWKKMGTDAKEAAQDTSQAVSKAKENAESMKNAAQNAAESIRGQFKKTTEVINGIPKEKVFNLKAKFDDDKLKTFSRKINDVPEQKSIWLKIKDGFSNSLKNAQQDANNTKKSFSNLREVMTGTFLGNAVLNGIYAIGNGLKGLIATGYQYTRQQQTMIASWNTLTGSASKGQEMVDMTNKLAISAQNSTEMVNDLNQKFYAVTNSAGKTKDLSQAVLTLQDAFNQSDASIENFSTQWAQMVGNGKASAQDMLSIQNVFPKFRQELLAYERDATHNKNLTMQQMNDMMSQGKISSKAMNDVLIGMGNKYKDATKNFTNTLDGMGRIIKTTAPRLLGALVEPFTKAQNPIYKAVSNWVSDPRTLKEFQNAGKVLSDIFNGAITGVADVIKPFQGLNKVVGAFIGQFASGAWKGITASFSIMGDAIKAIGKVIEFILTPVNELSKHLNGLGKAKKPIQGLGAAFGAVMGPLIALKGMVAAYNTVLDAHIVITKIATKASELFGKANKASAISLAASPLGIAVISIIAIATAFKLAYDHSTRFRNAINRMGQIIKDLFHGKIGWRDAFKREFDEIKSDFGKFLKVLGGNSKLAPYINKMTVDLKKFWAMVKPILKEALSDAKRLWKALEPGLKDILNYLVLIAKALKPLASGLLKAMVKTWQTEWKLLGVVVKSAFKIVVEVIKVAMKNLASSIKLFLDIIHGNWKGAWNDLKNIFRNDWNFIKSIASIGINALKSVISIGLDFINSIWRTAWNSFTGFFKGIWNGIKQAAQDGINGVISIINTGIGAIDKVWSFFTGHGTGISKLSKVHFAQGGTVHRHLSVINDGDGPDWKELVQMPDGELFMSQERNWTGFLPEGTRVYSGAETRQIMNAVGVSHYATGGIVGAQHFADGGIVGDAIDWTKGTLDNIGSWIGDKIDALMKFLDDPVKSIKGVVNKAVGGMYAGLGNFGGIAKGNWDKLTDNMGDWIKKHLEPVLDKLLATNPGGAGVARWRPYIERAAKQLGINLSGSMLKKMLTQINTESGGNPGAIGGTDGLADGHATGLLQFKPGTFRHWAVAGHGNIMSGYDQILAAFNALQHGGEGGWGSFGIPGRGWATGGEITSQMFGWVGDNPEHHEFVLNPYAVSAEPLLDRAFEATAQAQPANLSTGNGNSKLDQMIELLSKVVERLDNIDPDIILDGESIRKRNNKENAKDMSRMIG